jgi:hypothetical protein
MSVDLKENERRRHIFHIIDGAVSVNEAVIKLLKENEEELVCDIIIELCSNERSYLTYYGKLAIELCNKRNSFIPAFEAAIIRQYSDINSDNGEKNITKQTHNKANFFADLLSTNTISWSCLERINLSEGDDPYKRIFIKILFQKLRDKVGIVHLQEILNETYMRGLFHHDNPRAIRFAINFLTSIGFGDLTSELREKLRVSDIVSRDAQILKERKIRKELAEMELERDLDPLDEPPRELLDRIKKKRGELNEIIGPRLENAKRLNELTARIANLTYVDDPDDWTEHESEIDGRKYYYNNKTKHSTFDRPKWMPPLPLQDQLPEGWQKYKKDGKTYYSNGKESTWDRPTSTTPLHLLDQRQDDLIEPKSSETPPYYVNSKTKKNGWVLPKTIRDNMLQSSLVAETKISMANSSLYPSNKITSASEKTLRRPLYRENDDISKLNSEKRSLYRKGGKRKRTRRKKGKKSRKIYKLKRGKNILY